MKNQYEYAIFYGKDLSSNYKVRFWIKFLKGNLELFELKLIEYLRKNCNRDIYVSELINLIIEYSFEFRSSDETYANITTYEFFTGDGMTLRVEKTIFNINPFF